MDAALKTDKLFKKKRNSNICQLYMYTYSGAACGEVTLDMSEKRPA